MLGPKVIFCWLSPYIELIFCSRAFTELWFRIWNESPQCFLFSLNSCALPCILHLDSNVITDNLPTYLQSICSLDEFRFGEFIPFLQTPLSPQQYFPTHTSSFMDKFLFISFMLAFGLAWVFMGLVYAISITVSCYLYLPSWVQKTVSLKLSSTPLWIHK